jgi:hypothetical protein
MTSTTTQTLLDDLVTRLRACRGSADGQAEPVAILWTDPERQWAPLRSLLAAEVAELVELGGFDPARRVGPAIWLRCLVERTLAEPALPAEHPPILYLPGISHQDLRAGEETPAALRPLVELVHRGAMFLQRGGHDWTVSAFLTSPHALGLDVARDRATADALARALPQLARTPLDGLRGSRLDAGDFDRLLTPDLVRDLLCWMGTPRETRERMGAQGFAAFGSQCRARFAFDPGEDGETVAGERLGTGDAAWSDVWTRFEEAPQAFPGIPRLLERSKPVSTLTFDRARWPDENERGEREVHAVLSDLEGLPHADACAAIRKLDREHAERRGWVWARLGRAPLALVLEPLAQLAQGAGSALGGATPAAIAETYEARGWQVDAAALRAAALAPARDEALIHEAVQTLLEPWLEESALVFQRAVTSAPLPTRDEIEIVTVEAGECVLFVDGLRYDVGCMLTERLEARGLRIRPGRRWAALPTVTATAKPAVAPVAGEIVGGEIPADFSARGADDARAVDAASLRARLQRAGYQVLKGGPSDWPESDDARGWVEVGTLDERGHQLGPALAKQVEGELARLEERIVALLDAGWKALRIVTDHGWLWLPCSLPKVAVPKHLTLSRWARCAAIASGAHVDVPTFAWHWNDAQRFAAAPGIGCFNAEVAYAHGGVSIQECLIPDLFVERGGTTAARAEIQAVRWQRMRCFFQVESANADVRAELRLERPGGKPVAGPKPIETDRETSLLLEDDVYENADLVLVLLAPDGTILAQRNTRVGATS